MSHLQLKFAKELDDLTVGDLENVFCFQVLEDPENVTTGQYQRLKELVDERNRLALYRAVNADELEEKLRNIGATSSRLSSTTSQRSSRSETPSIEQGVEDSKVATYDEYNKLIELGGRPSAPIQPHPGVWDPSRGGIKELHVIGHWNNEGRRSYLELCRWEKFREYQQLLRKTPETFLKYVDNVRRYRQKKGIEGSLQPQLQLQPERQTKLDEWKEYYIYEHCKLGRLERRVKQTQLALESAQKELEAAETEKLREAIECNMPIIAGRVGGAVIDVEQHEALLQWVKQQLPLIASESAVSSQAGMSDPNCHCNGNKEQASNLAPSDSKPHISVTSGRQSFKNLKARSVLRPINSGKVSKFNQRKERPSRANLLTRDDTDQTVPSQASLCRSGRISQSTTNVQAPVVSNLRRSERLSKKSEKPGLFIQVPGPRKADPVTSLRTDPKRRPRGTANTRSSSKPQGVSKKKSGKMVRGK